MKKHVTSKLGLLLTAICFLATSSLFAQEVPQLNDTEIAHVGVVANQIDISYAEIAKKKSKNKEVINFAETMMRDHKSVIEQATALVTKLGVSPQDNTVSQSLLDGAEKTKKILNGLSARKFDKAYIDNEVTYHKAVIDALNNLLIKQSSNTELREFLQAIVPALETHLKHAEMVQKSFK
ncbi:DUF4142 domain-containing protein [Roseivirga sp.]|uniref:DUF4142 domain-containing protein n=1 Tax=Roseivirga sp. TaxID=1964215 RepID=UPI002B277EFA|nr:DUF4142 domain-containing protein [Roseivirga sp.]